MVKSDAYVYKRDTISDWLRDFCGEGNGKFRSGAADLIKFLSAHGITLVVDDDSEDDPIDE